MVQDKKRAWFKVKAIITYKIVEFLSRLKFKMTERLEQAIARLKTLSADKQDAIATLILEELEEEQRWDDSFARSPDLLAKLAAEAMTEYRSGKTQELDPDRL